MVCPFEWNNLAREGRPRSPPTEAVAASAPAVSLRFLADTPSQAANSRRRLGAERKCTGHIQEQNTLPSTMQITNTVVTEITAKGMAVFSARSAMSAPKGHRSVRDSNPMPQMLPMPPAAK